MNRSEAFTALSILAATAVSGLSSAETVVPLTPDDYAAIQQLDSRYAFAIETCTRGGYDYADLYVPDGEFGVAADWGRHPARTTKGRDALANADGGGPGGCRDPKTFVGYGLTHLIVNTVITPTAEGATSKEVLLVLGVGGDPTTIESQGGYESTYVRTPAGWRYKTRWHVFPNIATSVQFGPGSKFEHFGESMRPAPPGGGK